MVKGFLPMIKPTDDTVHWLPVLWYLSWRTGQPQNNLNHLSLISAY